MPYTEEELAGLTDDERAALLEDEDEGLDEEGAAEDESADEQDEEGSEGGDDQADGEDADEGGDADDSSDEDGDDGDRSAPAAPILVAQAPEDAEAQLQQIATDKAALIEKFDDGELTAKEYQAELDKLNKQERAIERAIDKAQIAADMERQRQVNEQEATINGFLNEHGIKRDFADLRFAALDSAVKIVASQAENAELSVREILQKAYSLCVEQGVIAQKTTKAESKPARKPLQTVPTLARVPAADMTGTDSGSRFAHLDRLDPVAREAAFAKLSPADQEAYLAS